MSVKTIKIINKFRILAVVLTLLPMAIWADFTGPKLPSPQVPVNAFDVQSISKDIVTNALSFRQWNNKEPMIFANPRGACDRAMNYMQKIFDHIVAASNLTEFVTFNSIGIIYYCDKAGIFATKQFVRAGTDGNIEIDAELFNLIEAEDSVAFSISHEIAHFLNFHLERHIQSLVAIGYKVEFFENSGFMNIEKPSAEISMKVDQQAAANSKYEEYEADRLGAILTYNAGYNPILGAQFLEKNKARFKVATHGTAKQRLERVSAVLGQSEIKFSKHGSPIVSPEFLEAKKFAELTARASK